jgi:molybdopterin/thiamine biosynthesis adenylyltransferase
MWARLAAHLFRADHDEHGAVILAGQAPGPRGPRLLGRELITADDGTDYIPGQAGYRTLAPGFVRDAAVRARDEQLAYLAVHNHRGTNVVGFSDIDLASHERGYPALRQITGQVTGGIVLTPQAAAGDLWLPDGSRADLAELVIPGANLIRLRPQPARPDTADPAYDRQARLFGDRGQESLHRLRVAVAGLGGAGSIITEFLARLGVGELVLIDDDTVDNTNLPRLLGATPTDIGRLKTDVAARNARRARSGIRLTVIPERIETITSRQALTICDWIFLAADSHSARHWVNATVHRYLIPATQVGVKIPVTGDGDVGQIHAITRFFAPGEGCMWCNQLIDPTELAIDMHPERERQPARYVDDVPAPSVITLNGIAATEAVSHIMLAVTSLHHDPYDTASVLHLPRLRERALQTHRQDPACPWCSPTGTLGLGDQQAMPSSVDHHANSPSR